MNLSPVFAILFHRLGRRRMATPFATKTDHPLYVVKLNALTNFFFPDDVPLFSWHVIYDFNV